MNSRRCKTVLALISLPLPGLAALADGAPELRHNPFSRPPSQVTIIDGGDGDAPLSGPLVVTVTMVSSSERLAHIDGRVLGPGDDIHGYQLLQILEDRVVLGKNEERVTVYVKPESSEDDEQNNDRRSRR